MAESILFGIAENLLVILGSLAVQEIGLALEVKNDLNKLSRTLATIKVVLLDAERQQATNPKLRIWLDGLKDVCSSANNVLDEFEILALQRQVMQRSTLTKKVQNFFSSLNPIVFNFKMGHKIKEIRLALDDIAKEKDDYNLSEQTLDRKLTHVWRETHSRVDRGDVIGRDHDEKVMIDHLLRVDDVKHVSVIPIVGIAGLGKTALAKSVFNDLRVIEHFKFTKWVCVSEDFDVRKIICNIVKCEESSLENMVEHLEQSLRGKRYLLVLDDVWNEDANKWESLRELLMCGANGSKIVVTTRSPLVASITHPTYTHFLEGLSDEDSLDLLMKQAFGGEKKKFPYLEEFGKDITKKCRGVPLAIRTLGSRLNMKTEVSEWHSVRDSEVWNLEQGESDILPALKLSYDALPPYLKQCFAVCSMFEKDHEFSGVSVIYLWMALGLLERGQNLEPEEIGKKYLTELLSRSFFQDYSKLEYKERFKMHDLMHDLTFSVTKSDCARLGHDSPNDVLVHPKVRHMSFDTKKLLSRDKFPNFVLVANDLRMIRVGCHIDLSGSNQYFLNTCISKFKFLRVLDLKRSSFEVLPNSIGGLKHLRYLDLFISMKLLPSSLCQLQSLLYLRLKNSHQGFERLPKNLRDLISLRYLKVGTNEICFPIKGIGSLTSLRTLIIEGCDNMEYLFDDDGYDRIGGMQHNLPNLRTLVIKSCHKLVFLPRSLRYLTKLETLKIANCEELDLMKDNNIEEVGSLVSLQVLVISRLPKLVAFPRWLPQGGVASTCLKKLVIRKCNNLTKFPEDLRYLQRLIIGDCPELISLSEGSNPLAPTLKELVISVCPGLMRRYKRKTGEEWHKISHIPKVILRNTKGRSSSNKIKNGGWRSRLQRLSFSLCKMTSLTELHHFTCNGSHNLFPVSNRALSSFPTFLNSQNLSIKRCISGNGSTRQWRSCYSVSTVTPPAKDVGSDGGESLLDCVIVGAGISGLCIAQALATKHQDQVPNVLVTEARDRVGGNIITVERDGFLWEEGPNSFQPSDPMLTMVVDSGLKDDLVLGDPEAPRFVLWNGKLRPVPSKPTDLPFFDLMSFAGKLRAGFGALGLRPPPPGHEESVEEFVRRNLGDEVFERLIEPFCSGVYAGDPSKLSMKAAFGKVWKLEQNGGSIIGGAFKAIQERKSSPKAPRDPRLPKPKGQTVGSFRKGLTMLPNAIARRLGNKVKLSWKLSSIGKMENGGYTLTYETPDGLVTLQSRTVVMTVPSHIASGLLRPISDAAAEALSKLYYPPVAAVSVSYPKEAVRAECLIDGELKGFGQLIPRSQGVETLGTIYSSSLFPNRAPPGRILLLNYIGGATNTGILSKTESQLVEAVDRDLRKMLINPSAKEALALGVRVWPQAIPQFLIGHLDMVDGAKAALSNGGFQGMFLGGNYVSGVALGRCVEGAYEVAADVNNFLSLSVQKVME